ncbi:hypothetical protein COCOBI_07-3600 [Coccomyxa sp. Obi]|nr:hypothetical protein COCOBI_07-3600 [Coccomyxa sp. Obi]
MLQGVNACCSPFSARTPFVLHPTVRISCKHLISNRASRAHQPSLQVVRADNLSGPAEEDDDEEYVGLTEEEDWVVPGGSNDSLSSNTQLGQAVRDACDELETLAALERQSLSEAQQLLEKLGYKGNVLHTAGQSLRSAPARIIEVLEPTEREQT